MSEFHIARAHTLGGSELAAANGLDPYTPQIELYRRKVHPDTIEDADNHHTRRGRYLALGIVPWYEEITGDKVTCWGPGEETVQHPVFRLLHTTPDGRVHKEGRGAPYKALEIKAPSRFTSWQWGDGGDEIPVHYIPQALAEAAVLGVEGTDVAALIDGDVRIYHVPFDEDVFGALIEGAQKFWTDHVKKKVPPPPDASEASAEALKRLFPRHAETVIGADEQVTGWLEEYRTAKAAKKEAEEKTRELQNLLQAHMGDAQRLTWDGGSISWKNRKDVTKVDWQGLVQELNPDPELVAKYTQTHPGPRVFRATFKKGGT